MEEKPTTPTKEQMEAAAFAIGMVGPDGMEKPNTWQNIILEPVAKALSDAEARGKAEAWLEGYNAHTREDDTGDAAKNPYHQR